MKKLFTLLVIASIAFVSCSKEEAAEPAPAFKAKSLADLKEHSGWDGRSDSTDTHP